MAGSFSRHAGVVKKVCEIVKYLNDDGKNRARFRGDPDERYRNGCSMYLDFR